MIGRHEFRTVSTIWFSRFRILYRIAHPNEIQIVAIGPRDRIHEETYRLIDGFQARELAANILKSTAKEPTSYF